MGANTGVGLPARSHGLLPSMSRLGWLIALQEENYVRLVNLFSPQGLSPGTYVSCCGDGLDLRLDVDAVHRYTHEWRLSYVMVDPVSGLPDPSAHIRIYQDAELAELTHCYMGRRWQDVLGLHPPARVLVGHRLRMNTFLGKWCEHLKKVGHTMSTLSPAYDLPPLAVPPVR